MGFKNLTKYVSSCCEFYVVWQLVTQPGADARKDPSPYIAVWLLGTLISKEYSDRRILTGIYFSIRSLRYTAAVPFSTFNVRNRMLYSDLKRTGSQCSWNKTGVICSRFRVRVNRRAAQFYTHCRRLVRERGILYSNALP